MKTPRIPQQLVSLVILFAILIASLIVVRSLLIPKTFGQFGHYRAEAVTEIAAQPIQYAGYEICRECHDDIFDLKASSNHRGLSCEICHGAAAAHAEAPDEVLPTIPKERGYCPLCHGYNPSRPTGFPQIIEATHNPGKPCINCHSPHNPVTPRPPQDCSACHREISSLKAVSPHVSLECTRCHSTPEEHRINPRSAMPSKPSSRDFCGSCHAKGADSPREIPRIDMDSHGERYVCWDCHYPHFPEAN